MRVVLIALAFGVLGFGWYLLSGGAGYQPAEARAPVFAPAPAAVAVAEPAATATPAAREVTAPGPVRAIRPAPEPERAALPEAPRAAVVPRAALRQVRGSRVALRRGPGPGYGVVVELLAGEQVAVVLDGGGAWVRMRALDGGAVGWVERSALMAPGAQP